MKSKKPLPFFDIYVGKYHFEGHTAPQHLLPNASFGCLGMKLCDSLTGKYVVFTFSEVEDTDRGVILVGLVAILCQIACLFYWQRGRQMPSPFPGRS